ncbi:MAG: SDR family oxidoreductase [Candidatus Thorarchaeota archaeon]|nr:SDR family oxidoreductase [Candidatus Thorarchaeota archaeon]
MELEYTTALVTGGAGFIGSHLVDRLLDIGLAVRVLDDMSNGHETNIERSRQRAGFELVVGDVRSQETVESATRNIDVVFHEAAKVSVMHSARDPRLYFDVNVMGTLNLLEACRRNDVRKFVQASSSSVYGNTPVLPKSEVMPTSPMSPYAVTKLTQETLALSFCHTYGLNTTALRYFNVYGPRQRGGSYAGVISIFISRALAGDPLPIEGDGMQSRDFTYVSDAVQANILAAASAISKGRVYNVGGGGRITIEKLADAVISHTQSKSTKVFGPRRLGDVQDSLADLKRIEAELGYKPAVDIMKGLAATIAWQREASAVKTQVSIESQPRGA